MHHALHVTDALAQRRFRSGCQRR